LTLLWFMFDYLFLCWFSLWPFLFLTVFWSCSVIAWNFLSWIMGRLFVVHLEGRIYSCKHCRTPLALCEDVVSKVLFLYPSWFFCYGQIFSFLWDFNFYFLGFYLCLDSWWIWWNFDDTVLKFRRLGLVFNKIKMTRYDDTVVLLKFRRLGLVFNKIAMTRHDSAKLTANPIIYSD